jgi:hypothetical protein
MPIASISIKSNPQSAATQVLLAASPLAEGVTGKFWADRDIAEDSKFLADPSMAKHLWIVSGKIVSIEVEVAA